MGWTTRSITQVQGQGHEAHGWLTISLLTSLCLGFLDVTVGMLDRPAGLSSFSSLFLLVATSTSLILFAYLFLWFVVAIPLKRILRLDSRALAVSVSMFLAALVGLESTGTVWRLPLSELPLAFSLSLASVRMAFMLGLILLVSVGTYRVARTGYEEERARQAAQIASLALPFILAATLVWVWLKKYWLGAPLSVGSLSATAGYLLTVLLCLVIFSRLAPRVRAERVLIAFLGVVLLSPAVVWVGAHGSHRSTKTHAASDHKIKRVILITVDTLRADALSSYNNKAVPTPHMDALAQDGILFEKAYSAAPWTVPSVASLMTGLPPQVHMMTRAENKLPDNLPTLAEHMRSAGYHTGAIVSNPYLRPQIDIYRGFLEFANFPPPSIGQSIAAKFLKWLFPQRFRFEGPRTRELTDLAIDWIEEHSENDFFLWLHYFDPHTPYTPPRDFLPPKLPPVAKSTTFYRSNDIFVGRYVPSLEQRAWIRDLYDAEVRYVDKSVGRFLAALKRNNIYDDALIVLTSDHGEEFFEHGRHGHAYSLYNEVLSVPLLIKLPNWASHRRVAMPVSNSRIMPTLLQLCQLDYDQNSVLGSSLVPLRNSDGGRQALPIFSTAVGDYEDRISLILDDIKYIRFLISKNREELYDLTQDPTEQVNLAPFRSHTVTRARELLDKHNDTIKTLRKFHGVTRPGSEELDAETKKRLEAVGYVQ